jgi:hypothetical protein
MTRGRTKSLAELYTQVTSMSQSTPVFNTSDSKKMHAVSTTLGASEDVASLVNKMLSQPTLSQTSSTNLYASIIEEAYTSIDEFEFSSPESTPMSKLRDSPHSISSTVMLVMMTNTTCMEEQVSIMAKTLEELMKSITEREARRDAQISFVMSKIENMPESNRTDGIQKKEVHREEAESSKNGEISKKFTIFFKWPA